MQQIPAIPMKGQMRLFSMLFSYAGFGLKVKE
jgi:hypothetical protein